jgi:hypothetical protein
VTTNATEVNATPRAALPAADQEADFVIPNNNFKVALLKNQATLSVPNPFTEQSLKADYVDMLGVGTANGFETQAASTSRPQGPRRKSLTDTDNNSVDFVQMDYRGIQTGSNGMSDDELRKYWPRNVAAGPWDPIPTERLMILQANTFGNDNGGFPKSLVELYNNTNTAINLNTGNYYLHIGTTGTPGWTYAIKLTGTVPARSSYLIVTTNTADFNTATQTHNPPLPALPAADQEADFVITNNNFKVAVLKNRNAVLTVANPFTDTSFNADYVDMVGFGNATGFEGAVASQSKPQIPRRKSLTDTDNNSVDFGQYDTRSVNWATNGPNITKYWPRNGDAGPWNPMP